MNINYITVIKAAKLAARDILRSRWVMNLLADIRNINTLISSSEKSIENYKKDISIAEYKIKQAISTKNPQLESIQKANEEHIKYSKENIENINKETKKYKEDITTVETNIKDITSGKTPISFENMTKLAKEMLTQRFSQAFVDANYDKEASKEESTKKSK